MVKWRALLQPWVVVLVVLCVYLLWVLGRAGWDVMTFVTLDPIFARCDASAPDGYMGGYDGQFSYYIARDPLNSPGCLDIPAYRLQRILLPLLGRFTAFGAESLIPLTMIAINAIVFIISVVLFEQLLVAQRVNRWYSLVYGLFAGLLLAVRLNTSEPLSYGLAIMAVVLGQRGRVRWEMLAWVGAVLAKETALVFVAGVLLYDLLTQRWRHALLVGGVVCGVFAAWQAVLYGWVGSFGVGSGGAGGTAFELLPFGGLWRILDSGGVGTFGVFLLLAVPSVIIPALWLLWKSGRDLLDRRLHPYTLFAFLHGLMMWTLPSSTFREPLGLMRVMSGFVIAYLLYMGMRDPRGRSLLYSLVWFAFLVYLQAG